MTLDAIQELLTTPVHLPLVAVALILASWALYAQTQRIQHMPLPPGPKSDPLIGHWRSLPASEDYRMYARWGRELNSDIISITVFGQVIVVLNSAKAVNELLDRRSAIYSNRPELPMLNYPDLVDWSKEISTLPYGERWRSQRRMTHKALDKDANMQYGLLALKQSRLAAQRISANPDNFIREISRMTASTILSTVYGYEVTSAGDPLVEIVRVTVDHYCSAAVPGNFLVNVMPWLRHVPDWFPGTGWKQTVKAWRKEKDEMVDVPYGWTKKQIASGIAPHSIVQLLLSELENRPITGSDRAEEEDKIKWVAASLFVAGVDTSTASMIVFILAMTLNQNVLAKAQAEIDKVIGQDRLPDMSDRESLPYIECVMKEVLRWQPIAPTAAPHACTQDDEYNGYFIPKGAVVIGNVWAINYNESVYHKPAQFNPDRFLDPHVPKPSAFGFGRRSCPGVHLAESVLFSTMATFLALFDIRPAKDEKGNEIIPDVKMEWNALVSYPADFKCSITPRSEKAIQLLDLSTLEA